MALPDPTPIGPDAPQLGNEALNHQIRTVTEMSLLMATELSYQTGQPRHVLLDHFRESAAGRIAAADADVRRAAA